MAEQILVLGGHGFIGKTLTKTLEQSNHQVMALSRENGLDLSNYDATRGFLAHYQPDVIVNLAAHVGGLPYVVKRHAVILADNVQIALNLFRAVQEVSPNSIILNPLSNCCYPGLAEIYSESDWLKGDVHPSVYSYGNAKRFIYTLSQCYKSQFGIKSYHFLIPNAFGPGDDTNPTKVHALNGMILRMLKAAQEKQPTFEIWGTGKPVREWIYVEDVAKLFTQIIDRNLEIDEPLNFAQGKGLSIHQSAELIAQIVDFQGAFVFNSAYPDGSPQKIMDDSYFRQIFPTYQFTDPAQAIRNTVDYYRTVLESSSIALSCPQLV